MKQFVTISATTVVFGEKGTNINRCGGHNYNCTTQFMKDTCNDTGRLDYDIGDDKINTRYSVDRVTGIFIYEGDRYQCRRFTGNAF